MITRISKNHLIESQKTQYDMVTCEVCSLNLADEESIQKGALRFCSKECYFKNDI